MDTYELFFSLSIIGLFGYQLWQSRKQAKSESTSPAIIEIYKRQRRLVILYIFITGIVYISLDTITPEMLLFLTFSLLFAIIIFEIVPLKITLHFYNSDSTDKTTSTSINEEEHLSSTKQNLNPTSKINTILHTKNSNNTNQSKNISTETESKFNKNSDRNSDKNVNENLDLDTDLDLDDDLNLTSNEDNTQEN